MHFIPTIIASARSKYSGEIKVVEGLGFRHLSTDSIQHSGGIVKEIWETALKGRVEKDRSWLVLGVAGGSVIRLISQKYKPVKIVGVDIDPVIVDLGKKYFGLSEIRNFKIIIGNAKKINFAHFDYILVDLFGKDSCPDFVYTKRFLQKILKLGDKVFINHLYNTPKSIAKFKKLTTRITLTTQVRFIRQNAVLIV